MSWHLAGGGQVSLLTKNLAPLFTAAGPGTECEHVHICSLLFENNHPLPDVTTFQSAVKALGLFLTVDSSGLLSPGSSAPSNGWASGQDVVVPSGVHRARSGLSSQKVGTPQRNRLLWGLCACPFEGRPCRLLCFSCARDVPLPPHVERCSRAVGVEP